MLRYAIVTVTILVIAPALADAQEWTRFRGPNGSGQSEAKTIPVAWDAEGYLWQTELPGVGHSSPVAWGEKLFLLSAQPANGTRHVLCYHAASGKQLWQKDHPAKTYHTHTQNSMASSTPTVDQDRVYCAWATPEELSLTAYDHDGRELWHTPLGPYESAHGFGASPILVDDLVILTDDQDADSFLFALDRRSGQVRWKTPRKVVEKQNTSYAAPCVYQAPGGPEQLIVCSWAHGISSIDPRSGKTNWETAVFERRPVGSPIIVDGLILGNCGEGGGNNNVVAVRPPMAAGGQPETVYRIDKTSAPYVPSLVAKGSLVFLWGDRGIVACMDAATGKIHWRERVGGNYSSSPVRVADAVYCVSANGEVVALAAKDKFEVLGRSELGQPSRATPAVAGGRMFLRAESRLFAVGAR